jgi:hypothetical protein
MSRKGLKILRGSKRYGAARFAYERPEIVKDMGRQDLLTKTSKVCFT